MPIDGRITGLAEMQARIRALQQSIRTQGVREGVKAGAAVVLQEMVIKAPLLDEKTAKSTALDPGTLKEDLRVKQLPVDSLGYATALIGPGDRSWHVALWVEYGHRLVRGGYSRIVAGAAQFRGPGREVGEVRPHPFLRPAFEIAIDPAVQAFADTLRKFFEEVLI